LGSGRVPIQIGTRPSMKSPKSSPAVQFSLLGRVSPSAGVPSTCRVHLLVPRLAACGEAGNQEVPVRCCRHHSDVLVFPPGLLGVGRAFGLVASSGVRPRRVDTTFYPS
jgi:hypothetical protein